MQHEGREQQTSQEPGLTPTAHMTACHRPATQIGQVTAKGVCAGREQTSFGTQDGPNTRGSLHFTAFVLQGSRLRTKLTPENGALLEIQFRL